jgi:hypothetical protein
MSMAKQDAKKDDTKKDDASIADEETERDNIFKT